MTRDWESTFDQWAKPPGKTEQDRFENAVRAIRDALEADDKLRPVTKVYLQGSYRNRVNVRQDSDIDLGNDADAGGFSEDGEVTCERTDLGAGDGFLDDVYTVEWLGGDGADFYTVMFKCSGGPGGRQQSVDVDGTDVDFTAGAFNGPGGVKEGWACDAWVKPKAVRPSSRQPPPRRQ